MDALELARVSRNNMILIADAEWDSLTILVLASAAFYGWTLFSSFRGGPLGRPYGLTLLGILVLLGSFVVRLGLDLEGIQALTAYGFSLKDFAVIISAFFFAAGGRGLARFWRASKGGFVGGKA